MVTQSQVRDMLNTLQAMCPKLGYATPVNLQLTFDLVSGRTLGQAVMYRYGKANKIRINPQLLEKGTEQQVFNTLSHEFAHIVDFGIRGKSDHSAVWKRIHKSFGGTGDRCTTFSLDKTRKARKFEYTTPTGGVFVLTAVRHNRIQKNNGTYVGTQGGRKHLIGRHCHWKEI